MWIYFYLRDMSFSRPKLITLTVLATLPSWGVLQAEPVEKASESTEEASLSIEQAKFQMLQIYSKAKKPVSELRLKYPALKQAAEKEYELRKAYSDAIQNHPQLKEKFEEINANEPSIPARMKLWKPLYTKADSLPSLQPLKMKYNQARVLSLQEEIKAIRAEGFTELSDQLEAILSKVKL